MRGHQRAAQFHQQSVLGFGAFSGRFGIAIVPRDLLLVMRQFFQFAPYSFGAGIKGFREAVGSEVMQARRVMPGEFGIATAAAAFGSSSVGAIGGGVGDGGGQR